MRTLVFVAVICASSMLHGQDFSIIKKIAGVLPRISFRLKLKQKTENPITPVRKGVARRCVEMIVNGRLVRT